MTSDSPQTENGYTRIANEILEALARTDFTGFERRIIDVILRRTWGFNKKEDWISLSQFAIATGMNRRVAARIIARLKLRKVVVTVRSLVTDRSLGRTAYRFNKRYTEWGGSDRAVTSDTGVTAGGGSDRAVPGVVTVRSLTKDIVQKTVIPTSAKASVGKASPAAESGQVEGDVTTPPVAPPPPRGRPEVNELIELLKTTLKLPALDGTHLGNRRAAWRMIQKATKLVEGDTERAMNGLRQSIILLPRHKFWRDKISSMPQLEKHWIGILQEMRIKSLSIPHLPR